MRRGELLAIRPKNLYEYGIKVRHSISPTSDDTLLRTQNAKRDVSINREVYELIRNIPKRMVIFLALVALNNPSN